MADKERFCCSSYINSWHTEDCRVGGPTGPGLLETNLIPRGPVIVGDFTHAGTDIVRELAGVCRVPGCDHDPDNMFCANPGHGGVQEERNEAVVNEPKNIGAIVRDAYEQAGIPVNYQKAGPVPPAPKDVSWLGRWQDVGWSIRIHPKLTNEQWDAYGRRAGECWDAVKRNYDPVKTMDVLAALFPTHELVLKWPTCGKRLSAGHKPSGLPVWTICGAMAKHTEVHTLDVNGARVGIARCEAHRGQL